MKELWRLRWRQLLVPYNPSVRPGDKSTNCDLKKNAPSCVVPPQSLSDCHSVKIKIMHSTVHITLNKTHFYHLTVSKRVFLYFAGGFEPGSCSHLGAGPGDSTHS